ncbi:MAG: hypothetical protein V4463_03355 [Pseudomonadota bacterium]
MDRRIVKLEVNADAQAKALEALEHRVEQGFSEMRADMRAMAASLREEIHKVDVRLQGNMAHLQRQILERRQGQIELRREMAIQFRWTIGIQCSFFLAVVARWAHGAGLA